jgi:predicted CoA-substrate-specific enzyme activase
LKVLLGAGVDVGSSHTKAVILDEGGRVMGRALIHTGANVVKAAQSAFEYALTDAGVSRENVGYVVGTGYGRYKVLFGDAQITEISCHAKGASWVFPGTRTVIDIGGQDAKAIRVQEGQVLDFTMNDKCAAGTGRFLENAAEVLGIPLNEMGRVSLLGGDPVRLTTVCTVFVESEIMSYLAQGRRVEDILAGIHRAIASRTVAMVRRVGIEQEVTFTGGVARNTGMVSALEQILQIRLNVAADAQFMGALGAALFGLERAHGTDGRPPRLRQRDGD